MKRLVLLCLCLAVGMQLGKAQISTPPGGANQKSIVTQYIGAIAHVSIKYNSPDVTAPNGADRTGKIWGQLVPYGLNQQNFGLNNPAPWRAGANENTIIKFSHDMLVQGQPIKAGKYGLHIVVEENGPWTIIFSKNHGAWGSYFYDEAEDALRVQATPEQSAFHEWLTYEFIDRQPDHAVAAMRWENIKLPFKIEVANINDLYVSTIKKELQGAPGFTWTNWNAAANYCLQNDTHLEQGLAWADASISTPFIGIENYTTLATKAQILAKLQKTDEAMATMDKAVHHNTATVFQIHGYGRQLIAQGQKEAAMKIFEYNTERFGEVWPTHVGMARGYSALGKYDKALKHAEIAHGQAPDQLNKDNLVQVIEKLKAEQDIN
ncbi:MAG: DUF2911 domain-containing protein [Bacteroidota bacterium]